jgi:hypothetical protein
MNELYDIVRKIEATPSKNDKLAILKANASNADLKEFFYLALEPTIIFHMKQIPAYERRSNGLEAIALESFSGATYDLVNKIASRELTGYAAKECVAEMLSALTEEDAELLTRVIKKDARCGVSEKTINKVWKGLVTEKLYMRCASFTAENLDRITYRALCQLKADGLFLNIIYKPAQRQVNFLTRNMKPLNFHGNLEAEVNAIDIEGNIETVIHGEGLVLNEERTGYLPRKAGNAIITKAIEGKKGISEDEASRIHLKVWDMMPLAAWKKKKCNFPYELRLRALENAITICKEKTESKKLAIIPTKMVNSLEEAYAFFDIQLAKGREGCILKNLNGIWKSSTSGSKDCVKMKKKDPADLICTGTYAFKQTSIMRGKTVIDTSNWIGGINLESADGKIKVNSGSGLDDILRAKPPSYFIGHIWEIEYNEIISSETKNTLSLFLPIIKERREDKDEADSYELILERASANKNKAK